MSSDKECMKQMDFDETHVDDENEERLSSKYVNCLS